jgi:hypothetical protein
MSDVMTPAPIREETEALCDGHPDLLAYVYQWVADPHWDLKDCPTHLDQHKDLLEQVGAKWTEYWGSINNPPEETEHKALLAALIAAGFTLDGLLLASMSSGQSIDMVLKKAEHLLDGTW